MKQGLIHTSLAVADFVQRYPRRITAVLATLMLTAGGGAYAVASLGNEVEQLPVQQMVEPVVPATLRAQSEALGDFSFNLYRTETIRASDTATTLLARVGVDDPSASAFIRRDDKARQALLGRTGQTISVEVDNDHALRSLTTRWIDSPDATHFSRLVIEKKGDEFRSRVERAPLIAFTRLASGIVQSNFYNAMDSAGVPDSVTTQLTQIFDGSIDFHRTVRKGDRFAIVYETLEADGETMRAGRVLSTEFVNRGKTNQAMWFEQKAGVAGGYYTLDGKSLRKSFLASPMQFSRITSTFGTRTHPIFGYTLEHKGVDYAAPTGAPIRVVGDGQVNFAGWQNGYGNIVIVNHGSGIETAYAHMSRIDVKVGQRVVQGENIGAVGSTGNSTGPHLHLELRRNGMQENPEQLAELSTSAEIARELQPVFRRAADYMRTQLAVAKDQRPVSVE